MVQNLPPKKASSNVTAKQACHFRVGSLRKKLSFLRVILALSAPVRLAVHSCFIVLEKLSSTDLLSLQYNECLGFSVLGREGPWIVTETEV
ncbi:hypothetical protein lerEdw1_004451 [Lerista edwardsae]|nr:hypothetical protein lerEdw1_004451 [Lerista edwardsae]